MQLTPFLLKCMVSSAMFALLVHDGQAQSSAPVQSRHTYQFSRALLPLESTEPLNDQLSAGMEECAVSASFIGDYGLSLRYADRGNTETPKISAADSAYFLTFQPRPAHAYLLERAAHEQIVMLNEAHHISLHRVFTLSLLKGLYDIGYRYLGAETLSFGDKELNHRGYPVTSQVDYFKNSGYYTAEPQYGNLIREALKIGFTVFPYDPVLEPTVTNRGSQRELQQAQNIQKILLLDPNARIVVQAGYDHIREDSIGGDWGKAMAGRVKEMTGIDPLTINQEKLTEKSSPLFENPYYKLVTAQEASVLINTKGQVFSGPPGSKMYDVRIFHPPTQYQYGRPQWLQLQGRRRPIFVKPLSSTLTYPCLVFAYHDKENPELAVAADIIELRSEAERKTKALILDPGNYLIVFKSVNDHTQKMKTLVKQNKELKK